MNPIGTPSIIITNANEAADKSTCYIAVLLRGRESRCHANSGRPSYNTVIISIYRLDIFDNVGIDCLLETGASTSKVIVILLSGSRAALIGPLGEC